MILGVLEDVIDLPPRQKLMGLVGALVVAGFLDWSYWYGPRQSGLGELKTQIAERRTELDLRRAKANARDAAERELRELSAELRRAQARLPDQREIADLLSNVAASGRAAGLEITLFRQKPEVYRDFYAEVPVEMQMRGTYHDVVTFLDRVKRLDRIVNVGDIQLKKPAVEGDRVTLEAACTTTTFRFLDEAERQRLNEEKKKNPGAKPAAGKPT
jgi:type IV pilus assembly protein PilO